MAFDANPDPDQAFNFDADLNPVFFMRLRIRIKVIPYKSAHWGTELHGPMPAHATMSLHGSVGSLHGSSASRHVSMVGLHSAKLSLRGGSRSGFHCDANADPNPASKK